MSDTPSQLPSSQLSSPNERGEAQSRWVLMVVVSSFAVFAIVIAWKAFSGDGMSTIPFMRGVVALIIAVTAVGLALMLAYQSFFDQTMNDDKFRRAREVYTGFMAILGTIIGFYFGTSDRDVLGAAGKSQFALTDLTITGEQLLAHVVNGKAPYRFTVEIGKSAPQFLSSDDKWLVFPLKPMPEKGTEITVTVVDTELHSAASNVKVEPKVTSNVSSGTPAEKK